MSLADVMGPGCCHEEATQNVSVEDATAVRGTAIWIGHLVASVALCPRLWALICAAVHVAAMADRCLVLPRSGMGRWGRSAERLMTFAPAVLRPWAGD